MIVPCVHASSWGLFACAHISRLTTDTGQHFYLRLVADSTLGPLPRISFLWSGQPPLAHTARRVQNSAGRDKTRGTRKKCCGSVQILCPSAMCIR